MQTGIQQRHQQIHQQIDQDKTEGGNHHYRLKYGDILVIHRLLGQLSEPAAAKNGFRDQRPGNQLPQQQPGNVQDRQQGVAGNVTPQDGGFTQPLARATATNGCVATWSRLRIRICASGADIGIATVTIGRISPWSGVGLITGISRS